LLGRVLHAILYIAGVVYLRTAAFLLGTLGEVMIFLQLFR